MRPAVGRLAGCLAFGLVLGATAVGWEPRRAGAAQVQSLFPSDRLTVPDPRQSTGRRVALPLPDCAADGAGCDEVRLLNELDGFSVNPRIAIRFSGPIGLDSLTRASAFLVPLGSEPLPSPIGLAQLVWDGESHTLYARPERYLLQAWRYALVLTSKVLDDGGQPLAPAEGEPLVTEAAHGVSAKSLVFQRLRSLGFPRRDVAAVSVFTTQSVTAGLEQMRAVLEAAPAPELRFTLGPGGGRSAYARVELDGLELRRQVSTDPAAQLDEARKLPLALVSPTDVRTIAFGRLRSKSFLTADRRIPATATRAEAPAPQGAEDVDVTVYLPAGNRPSDGWPVAIFGHGHGDDRHLVPMTVAGTLARFGFATIAMNVVGHGGGPAGTLTLLRTGRDPVPLPAGGRGIDLDGDGRIRSTEGVGTRSPSSLAQISVRDGLRQTTADLMQLGVLNVAGGPIVEIARQSPVFRGLVVEQLKQRHPPLLNGESDFTESIPLPGEAPVRAPAAGALDIQAYFDRAEWLSQSGDPVAFAPYLKQVPLPGVGAKAVLYQWAVGDLTVPNPTTAALLRAGRLEPVSSLYRHDLVSGLSDRFKNPHGFLAWIGSPEVHAIGRAAQEQVARFFVSGGRLIEPGLPQFEPAGRLPAGR